MVRSFLELNSEEKSSVLNSLNRNDISENTREQMESECTSKINGYGEGALFYIKDGEVLGQAFMVLEVAEKLKSTYIRNVEVSDTAENKEEILKALIDKCKKVSNKYNVINILLGIKNDNLLKVAENIGLYREYSSYKMVLLDKESKEDILDIIPLTYENRYEYVELYNSAFMDIPHGSYIELDQAEKCLEENDKCIGNFIVSSNGINIGFLDYSIQGNEGFFDIGLSKKYRGKGYGKKLLETAITTLNNKGINRICLSVIERNNIAFEMYKKRGFEIYEVLNEWIKIK